MTSKGEARLSTPAEVSDDALRQENKEIFLIYEILEAILDDTLSPQAILKHCTDALMSLNSEPRILAARIEICDVIAKSGRIYKSSQVIEADVVDKGKAVGKIAVFLAKRPSRRNVHPDIFFVRRMLQTIVPFFALYARQLEESNRAEMTQRQARDLSKLLMETPNPVLRIDRHGDVLLANPATHMLISTIGAFGKEGYKAWSKLLSDAKQCSHRSQRELSVPPILYLFEIIPSSDRSTFNLYGMNISQERENETRLTDIANDLPGAVYQFVRHKDGTDEVLFANSGFGETFGLTDLECPFEPTPAVQTFHPDDRAHVEKSVEKSAEELSHWNTQWRIVTASGKLKWLRGIGTPHRLPNGDTIWNSLLLDITERKNAAASVSAALQKTVHVLSAALEARDPYTAGHEQRVAEVSELIGRKIGLDKHQLEGLQLAATIHDVGKIRVPAEILSKPTRLTPAEFELIKEHSAVGANLLTGIDFEWPISDIVRQHHERLDGTGYPDGLAGENILIEARILGVADTLEAMANHRPYRPGLGIKAAASEIRRGAGTLYDPTIVKACLALVKSGEIAF
jgi:PAS domain S-box-containing protein